MQVEVTRWRKERDIVRSDESDLQAQLLTALQKVQDQDDFLKKVATDQRRGEEEIERLRRKKDEKNHEGVKDEARKLKQDHYYAGWAASQNANRTDKVICRSDILRRSLGIYLGGRPRKTPIHRFATLKFWCCHPISILR